MGGWKRYQCYNGRNMTCGSGRTGGSFEVKFGSVGASGRSLGTSRKGGHKGGKTVCAGASVG